MKSYDTRQLSFLYSPLSFDLPDYPPLSCFPSLATREGKSKVNHLYRLVDINC
jgi:hypothetical protein